ncbi:MAG: hypothetical protein IAE94_07125 [Chthoniobacterales bacterium]|nr:hypothetical protein [Chthoniobacterales bacterium]
MNIFILRDGSETGPLTWVDVFIMLRKGEISPEIPARIECNDEIKSLEEWGLWREGDEVGPFTWEEISAMLEAGVLDLENQARFEGDPELSNLKGVISQSQEICLPAEDRRPGGLWERGERAFRNIQATLKVPKTRMQIAGGLAVVLLCVVAVFTWGRSSQPKVELAAQQQTIIAGQNSGVQESVLPQIPETPPVPEPVSTPTAMAVASPLATESTTTKADSENPVPLEKTTQEIPAPPKPDVASAPPPVTNVPATSTAPAQTVAQTAKVAPRPTATPISSVPVSDFFKIESVKLLRKPPKDGVAVWQIPMENGKKGTPIFRPCLEVKVSVSADIRSDKTFAKAYFYGEDDKLRVSSVKPSESGVSGKPMYSVPVLFYKDKPNRFFFEIPEKMEKTKWKSLFVFGDKTEAQVTTYPPTASAFLLDYPEKKIVEDRTTKRVARKPDMDPLIEHVVRTQNPRMPQMTLFLRPPKGISNASEVEGVLAICVLANGLEDMKRELRKEEMTGDYAGLFSFANKHKLAILAWGSRGLWDPGRNYDDLTREKAKEIDESFDIVANAWARGVRELGEKYGIPQKNFLLWGNCGSAQFAARLCLRKPEYFLAVHVHMPGSYDQPTPEAATVLWCLTIGEREAGYERSKRWVRTVREMGYPIVYKAIPGLGHAGHPDAAALGFEFFKFALLQKDKREELDTQIEKTSYSNRGDPSQPWIGEFSSPYIYGDFVNQELFTVDRVEMIPKGFRVALPTKEIAAIWSRGE